MITVETDALTASTKMVYYRCLSSLGMPIPADTEVDKMPFNKNEDVYEGHNFDLDTLYAEVISNRTFFAKTFTIY